MKRTINITPLTVLATVPAIGFYEFAGSLYAVNVPNSYPLHLGPMFTFAPDSAGDDTATGDDTAGSGGISEATLLKAIAISQRPELAPQLVK